jgi:SNF2 family DNA or RNA helicase
MLLFSQFTSMLAILRGELDRMGVGYSYLDGSTPKQERHALMGDFNAGDVPVFLISLKAGGTGLNLTGADIVIHYDPWWNVSAENQATDRAHRIGQERNVQVFKLIAQGSIEEKILMIQEKKRALAESVVKAGEGTLETMTRDELMSLFRE